MRKLLLLGLLLVSLSLTVSAFAYNQWDDTGSGCSDDNSTACPDAPGDAEQFVRNGSFAAWDANPLHPNYWHLHQPEGFDGDGWNGRWAKVDYSNDPNIDDSMRNWAVGAFLRNTGGSSARYMYMSQKLDEVVESVHAWNQIRVTAWTNDLNPISYNSVAFYALSMDASPHNIPDAEWRELYPDQQVCQNAWEKCNKLLRAETVHVAPGMYYHVKVGNKFGQFNSWTVWGIDDISLNPINTPDEDPESGWIDEGDVTWDKHAPR